MSLKGVQQEIFRAECAKEEAKLKNKSKKQLEGRLKVFIKKVDECKNRYEACKHTPRTAICHVTKKPLFCLLFYEHLVAHVKELLEPAQPAAAQPAAAQPVAAQPVAALNEV